LKRFLIPTILTFLALLGCFTRAGAQTAPARAEDLHQPPPRNGEPIPVSVALHVLNLTDIDEVSERFNLMFYLLAQWHDPRLAFTPRDPSERFRVFTPDEVWHPRLEFVNAVAGRNSGDVMIRVGPRGNALYMERADARLSTNFHLRRFPFDRQSLEIIIHPFIGQAHLLAFTTDMDRTWISAEEKVYSSLPEWQLMGINARHNDVPISKFGTVAEAHFEIRVKRKYHYYLWKIFLPLLLMVVLSWTVYWIDTRDLSSQVQISITTILTVIAFAFSISLSLPKVPYLTYIDAFFLICLVFVFFTAIEMTTVHVSGRTRRRNLGVRIQRFSRVWVPIAFVIGNAILALRYFG
jgi:hypothetical protein